MVDVKINEQGFMAWAMQHGQIDIMLYGKTLLNYSL
jgi:hypothetical protein